MEFGCSVCEYTSSQKICVIRHINKKQSCGPGIKEIVEIPIEIICEYCNKNFTTKKNMKDHQTTCKLKDKMKDEEIRKLKAENKMLKEEMKRLRKHIENNDILLNKSTRKSIPKSVRDQLWMKYYKEISGPCYVCEDTITIRNFQAGHVISVKENGSDHIDNLRPICSSCNTSMGSHNLESFKSCYTIS